MRIEQTKSEERFEEAAKSFSLCILVEANGKKRLVQPYGIFYHTSPLKKQFCTYQIGGDSKSGNLPSWRNPYTSDIIAVIVLPEKFEMNSSFRPQNKKVYPNWIWNLAALKKEQRESIKKDKDKRVRKNIDPANQV